MNNKLFDNSGFFIGSLPQTCVKDCAAAGQVFEAVKYWQEELNFCVPQELARQWLRNFGAWDDLDNASDTTINQRILWLACCDIKESGEFLGVIE